MPETQRLQHDGGRLTIVALPPPPQTPGLAEDARAGLSGTPKSLPPKYFYDERGSWLFDMICLTPEYYPTRTEAALLARHAGEIVATAAPATILELGSGASRKTHYLMDACEALGNRCAYQPMDVCAEIMLEAARRLLERHDWLRVDAVVGDYVHGLADLPAGQGPRLFAFLGGTIGNFDETESARFLTGLRSIMGPEDWFLLGADRVKDTHVLNAAYNDAQGYTAEFNLNVLRVLNRELGASFDLQAFRHHAFFDPRLSRIEMHLVSRRSQAVHIPPIGLTVEFSGGESLLTEISRKFTSEELEQQLRAAGMRVVKHFTPDNEFFSLLLARRAEQVA